MFNTIRRSIIISPSFVFCLSWIFVLVMMAIKWSELIIDVPFDLMLAVISTMLASIFAYFFVALCPKKCSGIHRDSELHFRHSRLLLYLYLFGTAFELLLEGNFPLVGLFFGKYILYADYGVSGLHGFLNAIQLYLFLCAVYKYMIYGDKTSFRLCILFVSISILLMSRGMIMWQASQALFLYFAIKPPNLRVYLKAVFTVILLSATFIFMGNFRVKEGFSITGIAQISDTYPSFLSDDIIWLYLYFTTPFNNIANSIHNLETVRYYPFNTITYALPNVVKGALGFQADNMVILVDDNLNVSSYLDTFLPDFGLEFLWVSVFFMFIYFNSIYLNARIGNKAILLNAVFCTMAFLSIFTNSFTYLILLVQVFLIYTLGSHQHKKTLANE